MPLRENFDFGAADSESFAILFSDHFRSETGREPFRTGIATTAPGVLGEVA
jgi:hypothetical protein